MPWIEIGLPGTILGVKFLLKLFVDRTATVVDCVSAVIALPVDVLFLAVSLIAGFTLADPQHAKEGLLLFDIFLGLAVLTVVLWRRADSLFVSDRLVWTAVVALLNFGISVSALFIAVGHLTVTGAK